MIDDSVSHLTGLRTSSIPSLIGSIALRKRENITAPVAVCNRLQRPVISAFEFKAWLRWEAAWKLQLPCASCCARASPALRGCPAGHRLSAPFPSHQVQPSRLASSCAPSFVCGVGAWRALNTRCVPSFTQRGSRFLALLGSKDCHLSFCFASLGAHLKDEPPRPSS